MWRPSFLKHSLAWMSSLHGKSHHLICKALQQDTWQGLHTDHTYCLSSMDSQLLHQIEQRTRPREISSPLTGSPLTAKPNSAVTPSSNSAFVSVRFDNDCWFTIRVGVGQGLWLGLGLGFGPRLELEPFIQDAGYSKTSVRRGRDGFSKI